MSAYHYKLPIDYDSPGKPTDNSIVGTFNGSFRDECLNLHQFDSQAETQRVRRGSTAKGPKRAADKRPGTNIASCTGTEADHQVWTPHWIPFPENQSGPREWAAVTPGQASRDGVQIGGCTLPVWLVMRV